jgi:osmotically inducible lipoprotein OsmB
MAKFASSATRAGVIALALLNLAGCNNMDEMQQRMVSGGAIGVTVGAVGTVLTGGCVACGAAIGGAVGTAGGYIVDKLDNNTKSNPASTGGYSSSSSGSGSPYGAGSSVSGY